MARSRMHLPGKLSTLKRPIEKRAEFIELAGASGGAQNTSVLHTSIVAETFSGGKLIGIFTPGGLAASYIAAIVLLEDGYSATTLAFTNGAVPYEPEQNVLWMQAGRWIAASIEPLHVNHTIKTQRKMKEGDRLVFLINAGADSVTQFSGVSTNFFKQ